MPVALSNCNLANVCLYGGQAKRNGTQGCNCFAAPDCSSTEKCSLGLGGEPKADGTQGCNCITYEEMTYIGINSSGILHWSGGLPNFSCRSYHTGSGYYKTCDEGEDSRLINSQNNISSNEFNTGIPAKNSGDRCTETWYCVECSDSIGKVLRKQGITRHGSGTCK